MINSIIDSIEKFPDRNAFFIQNKYHTYCEFGKIVASIGATIYHKYMDINSKHIGVLIYDDIESYSSCIAILLSGYGYVPINPLQPLERTAEIIKQANIELILSSKTEELSSINELFPTINAIITREIPELVYRFKELEVNDNAPAYVIFTSGSTGVPKGTPISRKNLNTFLDSVEALNWSISEKDGFLNMSSMTFDMSIITFIIPLCVGACIYTVPEDEIKYLYGYKLMVEQNITFIAVVPSTLSYLKPFFDEILLPNIRYSLVCGEAFPIEIAKLWSKCVPNSQIINIYGPTEGTVFSHTYNFKDGLNEDNYNNIIALGYIVDNMDAIIIDENENIIKDNSKGELCLSGNQLTEGYLNNPIKNKESFFIQENDSRKTRFYRTGDIVFKDENECYFYVGRKDFQVKIQGHRVELGDIEKNSNDFFGENVSIALAIKNDQGNYHIVLFIEKFSFNENELKSFLKERLPYYMIPHAFHFVPKFPLNNNGKNDRVALTKYAIEKNK
jgi:D-alanine--poly(phosphoribitol) ligase subunit 1